MGVSAHVYFFVGVLYARTRESAVGLFDRFFGGKESKEERFVKKNVTRLLNKYGQKEVREEAMHALAQHGTDESIFGLLQRFTFNHPESIVDENEKRKVIKLLEVLGPELVGEPLRRYIADSRQAEISMALVALEQLEGEESTCEEIIHVLESESPDDSWSRDRKLQLINHLDNYENKSCIPTLLNFLTDINDDVVFRCIDLLDKLGEDDDIRDAIVAIAVEEDTSMRIRARILDLVRERKWFVGNFREQLEPLLPEGYYFDKRDNIKRSGQ